MYNGVNTAELTIPSGVLILPDYGYSALNAYNEVNFTNRQYIKRVTYIDLGNVTWTKVTASGATVFYTNFVASVVKKPATSGDIGNVIVEGFTTVSRNDLLLATDKIVALYTNGNIGVRDDVNKAMTAAQFKTRMSGVHLVYELDTPIVTDISNLIPSAFSFSTLSPGTISIQQANIKVSVPYTITFNQSEDSAAIKVATKDSLKKTKNDAKV